MRVPAWFHAPLPPLRSGVADHAIHLVQVIGSLPAKRPLYHLGNNQLHAEIYRRALTDPGVIVLHDAVLHHLMLGMLSREEYRSEFIHNYGSWSETLADTLWAERARSAADPRYFELPMIRRICERSVAVVVHNPGAAQIVRREAPQAAVHELPLLHTPRPAADAFDALAWRRSLDLDPARSVFGIFGYLRESKRIDVAIRACEAAGVSLVVAGQCSRDLEAAIAPMLERRHVRRVPFLSAAEYGTLMSAVDGCINLRYPVAGETSAVGIEIMAAGRPVLFTDSDEVSCYPASTCVRITPGLAEFDHLVHVLVWLDRYRSDAREIGRAAAAYIHAHHGPDAVLHGYAQVLT